MFRGIGNTWLLGVDSFCIFHICFNLDEHHDDAVNLFLVMSTMMKQIALLCLLYLSVDIAGSGDPLYG